jgi:hypothetical protein
MATPAQSALIRSLFRELEWDRSRITLQHTRMPHCTRAQVGDQVHVWLGGLSVAQASEAIEWLQGEVS